MYPTNCPNCAAPLHNGKCVHCGTEVVGEIKWDEFVELNLTGSDMHGNKYILPICGRINNVTMTPEYVEAVDVFGHVLKRFCSQKNIEFTFLGTIRNEKS